METQQYKEMTVGMMNVIKCIFKIDDALLVMMMVTTICSYRGYLGRNAFDFACRRCALVVGAQVREKTVNSDLIPGYSTETRSQS